MIGLLLGVIVVLLLRSTALSALAVRGLIIDALAFAAVVWALRYGPAWGASFGFALGLFADLDAAHWLGRHALALSLLGYAVGRLSSVLVRESSRTQLVLILIASGVHQLWSAAFEFGAASAWPHLLLRALVGPVATALIGTALLWLARRVSGQPLFENDAYQQAKSY